MLEKYRANPKVVRASRLCRTPALAALEQRFTSAAVLRRRLESNAGTSFRGAAFQEPNVQGQH